MPSRFAAIVVLAVCAALPTLVRADEPTPAQSAYEKGLAAYGASDFMAALLELERAYELDPRPDILFARAQALRRLGRCQAARGLFDQFISTSPSARQHEAARLAMTRCQDAPAPAVVAATPLARVQPPVIRAIVPPAPPAPWFYDKLAPGLLLGGLVLGTVGVFTIASARSLDVEARLTDDYQLYRSGRSAAERRHRYGLAAAIAGTALSVAGLGRYLHLAIEVRGVALTAGTRF